MIMKVFLTVVTAMILMGHPSHNVTFDVIPEKDAVCMTLSLSNVFDTFDEKYDGLYVYHIDGTPFEGWFQSDQGRYYLSASGHAIKGWYQPYDLNIGDTLLYHDPDNFFTERLPIAGAGASTKSECVAANMSHSIYFFDDNYTMHTGWLEYDGEMYYFSPTGTMCTGGVYIGNNLYYFDSDGVMLHDGWFQVGSKDHYAQSDGILLRGFQTVDDMLYYFNSAGEVCVGRTYVPEKRETFYFYENGGYATNTPVDGLYYAEDGHEMNYYYNANFYVNNGLYVSFDKGYDGYGRLYIPDVSLDVALYVRDKLHFDTAQAVADQWDSAVLMTEYGPTPFIADHVHQEFGGLHQVTVGTKAFIRHDNQTDVYSCYYFGHGINDGYTVYDERGVEICEEGDISMYTCNGCWQNVVVARFSLDEVLI